MCGPSTDVDEFSSSRFTFLIGVKVDGLGVKDVDRGVEVPFLSGRSHRLLLRLYETFPFSLVTSTRFKY